MSPLKAAAGLGLVAIVAACQPVSPDNGEGAVGAAPAVAVDDCGAAARQGLVGQSVSVLNSADLPEGRRIIFPGMAVTMDYLPGRLNIEIDRSDRIARVYCG